tara:strand:+ start:721 stop:996 length:276 start_codon:yes stop_codon:yes gene_type:complete
MTIMVTPSNFRVSSNEDHTTTITLNSKYLPLLAHLIEEGSDMLRNDLSRADEHAHETDDPAVFEEVERLQGQLLIVSLWISRIGYHILETT